MFHTIDYKVLIKKSTLKKGVKLTHFENYLLNRKVHVKIDIKTEKRRHSDEFYTLNFAFNAFTCCM